VSRHRRLLIIAPLLLSLLGCALGSPGTPIAEPSTATASAPIVPVNLDLCSLLTATEVSEALGEEVVVQPGLQTGACTYGTTTSAQPKSVGVSAAQGDQARDLVQMAASLGLLFGRDATSQQIAQDLKDNAASMPLEQVVEKANSLLAPLGYVYTPSGTPDNPTTWGWNPLGSGSMHQVREETYLAVSVIGLDEAGARALASKLLQLSNGRLPAAFTIDLAESLRVEFTVSPPTTAPEPSPTPAPPANMTVWVADYQAGRVARVDAATGMVLADIQVGPQPMSIAVGENAVWVGNEGDGTVSRIDPATNQVVATIPIGKRGFLRLAAGEGRVWVAACLDKLVAVIDPATNTVIDTVPADACWNVALGGGAVWVPVGERAVVHINPKTLVAIPAVFVQSGPSEIASGFGAMWVANVNAMTISRFDPESRQVTATLSTGLDKAKHNLHGLATGEGQVWLATSDGVQGFDPETNMLAVTFHAVSDPWFMTTANGFLWVTTGSADGIVVLDPATGDVFRRVVWGVAPFAIAAGP